ncbi:SH3 domain-binding glutamic acid-rich protein like protein [Dufourea novaeangliae]|uniref:SH3 domain-binding glutamic acid-rich protein like protein n=1 Tax=Dufourea novaeangliae TaxID=178035 RepID=A0A154PJ30_DUFNO|nr:SH3 domain-binding glutamic acid-rich protein like protein [Dufourea novaeangliae]
MKLQSYFIGSFQVKKRQQRVLMILDSKNVEYETIDITEPGKELDKEFMQTNGIARESKYPLPPQIFNEEEYCGDYEDFDLANEMDELEEFLKVAPPASATDTIRDSNQSKNIQENGNTTSREPSTDKDAVAVQEESLEERTALPNKSPESDESKPVEHDGGTHTTADEDIEHPEESIEKNVEKSDDQEKEE